MRSRGSPTALSTPFVDSPFAPCLNRRLKKLNAPFIRTIPIAHKIQQPSPIPSPDKRTSSAQAHLTIYKIYTFYTIYTATHPLSLYTLYTFYTAILSPPLYTLYTFYTVINPTPIYTFLGRHSLSDGGYTAILPRLQT